MCFCEIFSTFGPYFHGYLQYSELFVFVNHIFDLPISVSKVDVNIQYYWTIFPWVNCELYVFVRQIREAHLLGLYCHGCTVSHSTQMIYIFVRKVWRTHINSTRSLSWVFCIEFSLPWVNCELFVYDTFSVI